MPYVENVTCPRCKAPVRRAFLIQLKGSPPERDVICAKCRAVNNGKNQKGRKRK